MSKSADYNEMHKQKIGDADYGYKHPKSKSKALQSKVTGKSSKRQLYTESIPFLKKLADKEGAKHAEFEKKHGTWEERFKNYSKWKSNLGK